AVDDVDIAVRAARMVDEPRVVAANGGVDYRPVGQLEAPDVAALDVAPLPLEALLIGDLLAGVVNDARVLRNLLCRVDAPPMDLRTPLVNHAVSIEWRLSRSDRMRVVLAVIATSFAAVIMSSAQSS